MILESIDIFLSSIISFLNCNKSFISFSILLILSFRLLFSLFKLTISFCCKLIIVNNSSNFCLSFFSFSFISNFISLYLILDNGIVNIMLFEFSLIILLFVSIPANISSRHSSIES